MKSILSLFLMFGCLQSHSQIIAEDTVVYPGYGTIHGISVYYNEATYKQAVTDKSVRTFKITYLSDGLKVVAYLATPARIQNKKYPVIIFNRGSYIRNDIAYVHAPLFEKFINSGFIVIAPALRESEGGEGKDEMGGADLDDIFNVLPVLQSLKYADTSAIFLYGESRGGVMSLEALHRQFPAKAVAVVGAFTDFGLFLEKNPALEKLCNMIWPDFAQRRQKIIIERSAVLWAEQINVPLLIMQGTNDQSVDPENSLLLAEKMAEFKKDYQLYLINNGNHILSGKDTDIRDNMIIEWFKKHLR